MSKSFVECCEEVGLDYKAKAPEIESQWVAYQGGQVIPCASMNAAMKYSLYDRVTSEDSKKVHDEYFASRAEKESKAQDLFYKSLREEYSTLSDSLFQICYSEAYDRGHSAGYDEVANYMHSVVSFAKQVRKAK